MFYQRPVCAALAMFAMIFSGCEPNEDAQTADAVDDSPPRIVEPGQSRADLGVPFIPQEDDRDMAARDVVDMPQEPAGSPNLEEMNDQPEDGDDAAVIVEGEVPDSDEEPQSHESEEDPDPQAPDDDLQDPIDPDMGECMDTTECPMGLVCTVEFGDCILRADEDVCYGFCLPADANDPNWPEDGAGPEDPCAANPEECGDNPNEPLPGDEFADDEPPPGCGEGEDPCEANFQACMEAVENVEGIIGDIDEDWCADELNECRALGLGQDDFCGGGDVADLERMCQEQLDVCLEGLDENNEEDRVAMTFCYDEIEICKAHANDPVAHMPQGGRIDERCDVEFQACIDANDPGPDASIEEVDEAFAGCDANFMACVDAPLQEDEGPGPNVPADE
jgi:hypothetical protein